MATTMPATTGTSSISGFITIRQTPLICAWMCKSKCASV